MAQKINKYICEILAEVDDAIEDLEDNLKVLDWDLFTFTKNQRAELKELVTKTIYRFFEKPEPTSEGKHE